MKLAVGRFPSNYELFFNYVSYLLAAGRYDEVVQMTNERKFPEMDSDAGIWLNLGVAHTRQGDLDKARAAYEKFLLLDERKPTVLHNLATCYFQIALKTKEQGLFRKSIECFKKAIELDPEYASPYVGLGAAYDLAGNSDGAIYCWEKAMEVNYPPRQAAGH